MGQLGGKSVRTLVTSLEILSDDGEYVLMVDSNDGMGGNGVKFRVRRPWDSTWGSDFPTFTVAKSDADVVSKLVGNLDASYSRAALDEISSSDFRRDNPNPPEPDEAKADCTQLDIERAKAANLAEERELLVLSNEREHALDKHVGADVPGCPACERKHVTPALGYDPTSEDDIANDTAGDLPY